MSSASGWVGQGRLFRRVRSQKISKRNQARAGREGKGVWGKRNSRPARAKVFQKSASGFSRKKVRPEQIYFVNLTG